MHLKKVTTTSVVFFINKDFVKAKILSWTDLQTLRISTIVNFYFSIEKPLLMISHHSWETREVPVDWRLANIVLIVKKGKKEDPGNYRPISLTSVPGKVVEKIILRDVEKHLKDNVVIGHSQHSFMRGRSYLSKLISFYDNVIHLIDQGNPVDAIILDFSKAFYRILLDKMSSSHWINT
ncbi:hypothetical protein HGM15179_004636 [Zosterops borbonicus]|uniref:Reverse transcriptase domain-containing protein n=1 Tax=Zosterops borbonicus TaxID=364589 RepID=A0A8K1LQC8_9PASS|nr:hypothetical protein HGM15179_004636 [Zosterops borbonicus]